MTQQFNPIPTLLDLIIEQLLEHLRLSGQQIKDLPLLLDLRERIRETVLEDLGVADWIQLTLTALERQDKPTMRELLNQSPTLVANIHRSQVLSETQKQRASQVIHDFVRRLDTAIESG
jgi:hypothetical protein